MEVDGKGGSKMDLCDRLSLQKETPPVVCVRLCSLGEVMLTFTLIMIDCDHTDTRVLISSI